MNSEFQSLINSALAESIQYVGEPIIIGGKTISGIVSSIELEQELLEGGMLSKRGISVIILKAVALSPAIGELVLYSGKAYRIIEIRDDFASYELILETGDR